MALFERDQLPSRSALSRLLAALTEAPVEALRTLFLDDLLSRPLSPASQEQQTGGLVDRAGTTWVVFDIDGTREAARQRALPQGEELPPAFRRLDDVCAPGYTGRKRGQVVRTRTVVSQAHSFQWLGSFGNRGNGRYRADLRQGLAAIGRYLAAHQLSQTRCLLRLDGQYGTGAVLADLAGFAFVTRGKDYRVLDHPLFRRVCICLPISSSSARKAKRCAVSTIALRFRSDPKEYGAGWWWQCIQQVSSRVPLASHGQEWSTNSSLPPCRNGHLLPLMSSNCICIAGLLSQRLPMRTRNRLQVAGARTPPAGRKPGRSWPNGCGTSGWNWAISSSRTQCVPPNLHPRSASAKPGRSRSRATNCPSSEGPGKLAALRARTLSSSRMGPCAAPLTSS